MRVGAPWRGGTLGGPSPSITTCPMQPTIRLARTEDGDEIARGGEAAQRVRATADRTVVELTSEARKKAEIVRGEADARRNAIYAAAFGRDPEFFAFTRSMTSYERALRGENSSLVIQPEGEFFDYLKSDGAERANPVPAAAAAALSVVAPAPAVVPAATEAVSRMVCSAPARRRSAARRPLATAAGMPTPRRCMPARATPGA